MPQEYAYYAFISYSHEDAAFARTLQRHLEHYRLPSKLCRKYPHIPRALKPIFRDESDLPIGQLSDALKSALAASRHLIVLCSQHSVTPSADGHNWVNEELRMFLELHREQNAIGRIIPIILREEGGLSDAACLLPTIRELDILAADLLTKGEERIFNDVIAKMAGLKPDILWDRHQREQQRKRRVRRICGAATTLAAAAAGLWCWSYYVPHHSYYRDYIERNNLPEGLFELTEEQMLSQHRHYRFTHHKHRLRRVEYCNSAGTPQEQDGYWPGARSARMELEYGEGGTVARCIHLNSQGKEQIVRKYAPGTIDFVQRLLVDNKQVEVVANGSNTTGTEETAAGLRHYVQREQSGAQAGIISRILYCKPNSLVSAQDAQGVGGMEITLDALGRAAEQRFLAVLSPRVTRARTKLAPNNAGVSAYRYSYGEQGNITRLSLHNDKGEPIEELHANYDAQGRMVEYASYTGEGQPCIAAKGSARLCMAYDARGNQTELASFGVDGRPCISSYGFARATQRYDEHGNRIELAVFGVDGTPCLMPGGYARVVQSFSPTGKLLAECFYGTDGEPCLSQQGYASATTRYNEREQLLEMNYYGTDGKPILAPQGYARLSLRYDERGNPVEVATFGADAQPCAFPNGIARTVFQYDERGELISTTYYNTKGDVIHQR